MHCQSMKTLEWTLGGDIVDELYEHKSLAVLKNYVGQ